MSPIAIEPSAILAEFTALSARSAVATPPLAMSADVTGRRNLGRVHRVVGEIRIGHTAVGEIGACHLPSPIFAEFTALSARSAFATPPLAIFAEFTALFARSALFTWPSAIFAEFTALLREISPLYLAIGDLGRLHRTLAEVGRLDLAVLDVGTRDQAMVGGHGRTADNEGERYCNRGRSTAAKEILHGSVSYGFQESPTRSGTSAPRRSDKANEPP